MKKILKTTGLILLTTLVALFFDRTCIEYHKGYWQSAEEAELIFYFFLFLCFGIFFRLLSRKLPSPKTRLTAGAAVSLLFCALIFLSNNYFRYLHLNSLFHWEFVFPYKVLLWRDLNYAAGLGEFRYPLVFAAMMLFCGLTVFFTLPKVKETLEDRLCRVLEWIYLQVLKTERPESVFMEYNEDEPTEKLTDYVLHMPLTEKKKNRLIRLARENDDCLLISLLFQRYEEMLTREEYQGLREQFVTLTKEYILRQRERFSVKTVPLPEVMQRLDEKFDLSREESV